MKYIEQWTKYPYLYIGDIAHKRIYTYFILFYCIRNSHIYFNAFCHAAIAKYNRVYKRCKEKQDEVKAMDSTMCACVWIRPIQPHKAEKLSNDLIWRHSSTEWEAFLHKHTLLYKIYTSLFGIYYMLVPVSNYVYMY